MQRALAHTLFPSSTALATQPSLRTGQFARVVVLWAWALLVFAVALGAAPAASAQTAPAAKLSSFDWRTPEGRVEFRLKFSAAPTLRVTDELVSKHYFFLDFLNVAGPAEQARWDIASDWINHVRRVYYPEQRVLRFVFYTNKDIRFEAITRGERDFEVVVTPIQLLPLAQAGSKVTGPRKLVVIDPGHGGLPENRSVGAASSRKINGRILYEKDLVLEIGNRLRRLIDRSPNLQATMTRTEDVFVSLEKRIDIANEVEGDMFVSIHLNGTSSRKKTARGFEVYYLSDGTRETNRQLEALENDEAVYMDQGTSTHEDIREILRGLFKDKLVEQTEESKELAGIIGNEFERLGPFREHHRGVKSAAFRVLMNVTMPSVLVECGFIDHPVEGEQLADPKVQEKMAGLLFNAINRYFAKSDPAFVPYYLPEKDLGK